MPVLLEADFQVRLEAAKALRQEEKQAGKDHLKNKKKKHHKHSNVVAAVNVSSQAEAYDRIKESSAQSENNVAEHSEDLLATAAEAEKNDNQDPGEHSRKQMEEEANIEIDPLQCLFDRHCSTSVQSNAQRMQRKYGFFVPDREYLADLEGLIGYCHEKIKLGHMCLYCQRVFTTWQGCQRHMISTNHTKLRYEPNVDLEDLSVFYDFSEADAEFLGHTKVAAASGGEVVEDTVENIDGEEGDDDSSWEDITDDETAVQGEDDEEEDEEDQELYAGFEDEAERMGFSITPLGELVFPDGRIVGHRSLRRYYKQRSPQANASVSVLAARKAARERLFRGHVYNISYGSTGNSAGDGATSANTLALAKAGIAPGVAAGRSGRGILVPSGPGGSFSQLSIYRYRAAIRKQRRDDFKGRRLHNKTNQNINRMDKKHNRLMNGVSVAHAAR